MRQVVRASVVRARRLRADGVRRGGEGGAVGRVVVVDPWGPRRLLWVRDLGLDGRRARRGGRESTRDDVPPLQGTGEFVGLLPLVRSPGPTRVHDPEDTCRFTWD